MLTKYRQISVIKETTEGTHPGSESSSDLVSVIEPEVTFDLNKIDRNLSFLSLSNAQRLTGIRSATVTFQVEAAGLSSLTAGTAAPFDLLVRACGYRQHGDPNGPLTVDPSTPVLDEGKVYTGVLESDPWQTPGTFTLAEVLTQETSGATFKALSSFTDGDPRIFLRCVSGTVTEDSALSLTGSVSGTVADATLVRAGRFYTPIDKPGFYFNLTTGSGMFAAGDVVSGDTSGARAFITQVTDSTGATPRFIAEVIPGTGTFSSEAVTNESQTGAATGMVAAPFAFDQPTLAITLYEDGNRIRIAGCRGNCVFTMTTGNRGLFNFTFQGGISAVATAAAFAPAVGPEAQPNMFLNGSVTLSSATYAGGSANQQINALISEASIDFGASVVLPPDVNQASGIKRALITDREPTISMDPEAVTEDVFDLIQRNIDSQNLRFSAEWGINATEDGNGMAVHAPAVSYDSNAGDRDGSQTFDIEGLLTSVDGARGDELVFGNI